MSEKKTTFKVDFSGFEIADEKVRAIVEAAEKTIAEAAGSEVKATTKYVDKTGNLRKSTKVFKSKFEHGGYIVSVSAPHAHLIEYGTADRSTSTGQFRGKVTARPFLRPMKRKYTRKFRNLVSQGIERMSKGGAK